MKYKDIKDFYQRCEEHPDHQSGMISNSMIQQRLHEEIDELREHIEKRPWVGLTRDEQSFVYSNLHNATSREDSFWVDFANAIEAKLKEKNA
jgi:hypothetical protein